VFIGCARLYPSAPNRRQLRGNEIANQKEYKDSARKHPHENKQRYDRNQGTHYSENADRTAKCRNGKITTADILPMEEVGREAENGNEAKDYRNRHSCGLRKSPDVLKPSE